MDNSNNTHKEDSAKIIILNCAYGDRNQAQKLGAAWNNKWRAWCIDETMDKAPFKKWLPKGDL